MTGHGGGYTTGYMIVAGGQDTEEGGYTTGGLILAGNTTDVCFISSHTSFQPLIPGRPCDRHAAQTSKTSAPPRQLFPHLRAIDFSPLSISAVASRGRCAMSGTTGFRRSALADTHIAVLPVLLILLILLAACHSASRTLALISVQQIERWHEIEINLKASLGRPTTQLKGNIDLVLSTLKFQFAAVWQ